MSAGGAAGLAGLLLLLAAPTAGAGAPARSGGAGALPGSSSATGAAAAWRARRGRQLQRSWGVDVVGVRRVASGSMLRFDYRVVDPARAAALTDRRTRPFLIDEATRTALAVPAMEKVGELRQVAPLERHRTYFMIFGNPGGLVKRGGRVTLAVGDLRAEGLVVE
ncbi:hypothetical protein [Anaeromyxobacter paludicola]|uniref:Uncharacterized protein n=1 Tax=Anaeromyxobacter paludicola TaxID=2918171 RepID=A0ABN6NC70_9BACT|nr:hypothetical protein [Anaeromyxobacter paludicola]BDG10826.1 hypothetical protein AMPC_39390 [Anaeromyxobacter paludicola]